MIIFYNKLGTNYDRNDIFWIVKTRKRMDKNLCKNRYMKIKIIDRWE